MQSASQKESAKYVRAKTLAAKLNCGESTVWRMVSDGRLPQPAVKLGKRCTLWHWPSVEAHLIARSAAQQGD